MMTTLQKVQSPESILTWRRGLPGMPSIAVVTGTFDLIHPGNLHAIRRARALARHVIVVVASDEMAATHGRQPQNPRDIRVELVSYLRDVQAVTSLAPGSERAFFEALAPQVWVTARQQLRQDPDFEVISASAGRVEAIEALKGCFTDEIISAMEAHRTPLALPAGWDLPAPATEAGCANDQPSVSINGCFDILHIGHLRFMAEARALGASLTVFINDDPSVARYKGSTRPVFPAGFRMMALKALQPVEGVIVFAGDNPLEDLRRFRPMIHVKGGSYEPDRVRQERELVESWGGRLVITPLVEGFSTTHFITRALTGTP